MTESDDNFVNKRWRYMCYMLVLFSLKPKHIQFTVIYGKENCQILAIEKQQSINVGIYLSITNICLHTHPEEHT